MFHESFDGATLARGVSALEEQAQLEPGLLHLRLQLEELDLKEPLGHLVLVPGHPLFVWIALPPGSHLVADR
jgi:hypothetical protein